jgi:signal transduction histidine kinase
MLDPVLEANSRGILGETLAGVHALRAGEQLDLVSVDYAKPADLAATGTLRAFQNLPPAESLMAAEVLFGVALPLVVERLQETPGDDLDAVLVARLLHHSIWRRFPPGAIAYVEIIRGRLSSANQDSRRRVSRELHDRVAHGILAGLQRVELAAYDDEVAADAGGADARSTATRQAHLRDAIALLQRALADVQDMAVELRQLVGDRVLDDAIADYLVDSEAVSDRVVVESVGRARILPSDVADEVFTIVREAIRNARDHADGATAITVRLDWAAELTVTVADNGPGFDPVAASDAGLGLVSMRERAEMIGAELDWVTGRGGTSVVVRLPLGEARP